MLEYKKCNKYSVYSKKLTLAHNYWICLGLRSEEKPQIVKMYHLIVEGDLTNTFIARCHFEKYCPADAAFSLG